MKFERASELLRGLALSKDEQVLGAEIEATPELWVQARRDVKRRIRPSAW